MPARRTNPSASVAAIASAPALLPVSRQTAADVAAAVPMTARHRALEDRRTALRDEVEALRHETIAVIQRRRRLESGSSADLVTPAEVREASEREDAARSELQAVRAALRPFREARAKLVDEALKPLEQAAATRLLGVLANLRDAWADLTQANDERGKAHGDAMASAMGIPFLDTKPAEDYALKLAGAPIDWDKLADDALAEAAE